MTSSFSLPRIFAHRGASYDAPENTRSAIELAANYGAKWVEVDLHLTRDEQVVIIHDPKLNKVTNGKGSVLEHDYATLAQLDAGSWFDEKYSGEKLLSLETLIILLQQLNINANLELKPILGYEEKLAEVVAKTLKAHWPSAKPWPLISSFSLPAMRAIKHYFPELPRAMLIDEAWSATWRQIVTELGCVSVNTSRRVVTEETVRAMHEVASAVSVYTVNTLEEAERLFSLGVDAIFTDRADLMLEKWPD